MSYYKHILFDLDGTLSDPSSGIINSLKKTLSVYDYNFDESHDFSWVIGPTLDYAFSKILETNDKKTLDEAVKVFREFYKNGGLFENELFSDVPDLLSQLKKSGIQTYVATSKPQWFAEPILEKFEIYDYFTEVCGSLQESRKSKSEIIDYIMKKHDLKPQDCLMVGDRKFDILGAKEHGMSSVGVTFGFAEVGELEEAQPNLVIDSFDQLIQFVL